MPKISEKAYEVPMADGSYQDKKIKIDYNVNTNKFEMKLPEHIGIYIGQALIHRANEKELLKEFKKHCKAYSDDLSIEPERFIKIDYDMKGPHPTQPKMDIIFPEGHARAYYKHNVNQIEIQIDYDIYEKRGKSWFNHEGERLDKWNAPNPEEDILIPWTQEREDALQRFRGDLVSFMTKIHQAIQKAAQEPDSVTWRHIVSQAARRTAPAPQPTRPDSEGETPAEESS